MTMRITPSIMLTAKRPCSDGTTWPSCVARNSGTNLYMNRKNSSENARGAAIIQRELGRLLAFLGGFFARVASSATLAENCSAFTPSVIACPSVPSPRRMGSLKIGYFSDIRGSGLCSVTISPFDLRTATQ